MPRLNSEREGCLVLLGLAFASALALALAVYGLVSFVEDVL